MKFGFRTPSFKKRIAARTSPKRFLRHNLGLKAPRGFGWLTNPKKAAYNRVYNRTTKGCMTLILSVAVIIVVLVTVLAARTFGQTATVIAEKANLRGTPSNTGKVVAAVEQNTVVEILKQRSPWFLVQTAEYAGWLHGNTIKLNGSLTVETMDENLLRDLPVPRTVRSTISPPRASTTITAQPKTSSVVYTRGPRGGCYYINSSGKKTYVDHSYCD